MEDLLLTSLPYDWHLTVLYTAFSFMHNFILCTEKHPKETTQSNTSYDGDIPARHQEGDREKSSMAAKEASLGGNFQTNYTMYTCSFFWFIWLFMCFSVFCSF